MRYLFILLFLCTQSIFAQQATFIDRSVEMPLVQRCTQVGDKYFLYKPIPSNWRADGYYIVDKDLNLIRYTNMTYSKDAVDQTDCVLGNSLYCIITKFSKENKRLDFIYVNLEKGTDEKVFQSETGNYTKDMLSSLSNYQLFLSPPNRQKMYRLWQDPLLSTGTYKLFEYDTAFNLVSSRDIEIQENLVYSTENQVSTYLDNNDNLIISAVDFNGFNTNIGCYSLKTKKYVQKTIGNPKGFCCPKTTYDANNSIMYITFDENDPNEKPFTTVDLDFKQPVAKVIAYNLVQDKLSEFAVKLNPDEIDSLKDAGNLKKEVNYTFRVETAGTEVFANGNFAIYTTMENFVHHDNRSSTVIDRGDMEGTNNIILRVYDKNGNLLNSKSLYRSRKYLTIWGGMNVYMLNNKLLLTCDNRRRNDGENNVDDGTSPFNFYSIDDTGKVNFIKSRIDKSVKELPFGVYVNNGIIPMNKDDV